MPRVAAAALLRALDRLDAPIDEWLVGISRAVYELRRGRDGVRLFTYALEGEGAEVRSRVFPTGEDFEIEPDVFHARLTPEAARAIYRAGARVGFVGEALLADPGIADEVRKALDHRGAVEVFNVHAAEADQGTVMVIPSRDALVHPRTLGLLQRSAVQLRIGLRFRDALTRELPRDAALVTPEGRVEAVGDRLAEGVPVEGLRALVRAREASRRARAGDGDVDEGASWLGLLRGEWSCVDVFEASGRRHVVVARTPPTLAPERALAPRDALIVERLAAGASAKATAIDLGISEAEVSRALARALACLGLRDRSALVQVRSILDR
ncbi:MAG: hypothetical protein R3B09_21115 [Nannocystaceae bacterium]